MKKAFLTCTLLISLASSPLFAANDAAAGMNIAKLLSDAFARAAKRVTPATVFIIAEGESHASDPYYNAQDPFGLFGDEFFQQFFGQGPQRKNSPKQRPPTATGSGFLVSTDGYIMTNYHVVQNAKKLTVTIDGDKTQELAATFIGGDPQTDTAIIKLDHPPENLPFLEFANSDSIEVGEWILAVGSPFQLEASVTTGIVSAKGRKNLQVSELENFIQTDAAINPGNSGGPLVNLEGKVIGINTAIVAPSGGNLGIGFAVPSNIAQNVMEQIIKTGSVTRGYIGVSLQPMDKGLAESFGLEKEEGVIIADVLPGSAGEKAGLRQGDVVIEVDGTRITHPDAMRNEIMLNAPGTKVQLKVLRDGKTHTIPITLGSNSGPNATEHGSQNLGLVVEDINQENIRKFRLSPEDEGVVIIEVKPGTIAARANLKPGYVIIGVDHQRIKSTEEFQKALAGTADKKRILLLVKQGNVTRFYSIKR
jgi:serine protease Do